MAMRAECLETARDRTLGYDEARSVGRCDAARATVRKVAVGEELSKQLARDRGDHDLAAACQSPQLRRDVRRFAGHGDRFTITLTADQHEAGGDSDAPMQRGLDRGQLAIARNR